MATIETYSRVNWNSTTTYINPTNLNNMDKGIKDNNDAIIGLNNNLTMVTESYNISNDYFSSIFTVKKNGYMFSINAFITVLQDVPNAALTELPIALSDCEDTEVYATAFTNTGTCYAVSKNANQKLQIENYTGTAIPTGTQLKIHITMAT